MRPSQNPIPKQFHKHLRLRKKAELRIRAIERRAASHVAEIRKDVMDINLGIGHLIKVARVDGKLRAVTVARRIGISPAYLTNLESGRNTWTDELLGRAFVALGFTGQ